MIHDPNDEQLWQEVYHGDGYRCKGLISPGMRVVDVGAHHGAFALLAAELGADVLAFEPETGNHAKLVQTSLEWERRRAMTGGLGRIQPSRCAVIGGRSLAEVWLHRHRALSVGHSMVWSGGDYLGGETVPAVPLDVVLALLGRVDLLKVDCEGAEVLILGTSSQLHRVERMVVEWHMVGRSIADCAAVRGVLYETGWLSEWVEAGEKLQIEMLRRC